jgi:hypothetical protein
MKLELLGTWRLLGSILFRRTSFDFVYTAPQQQKGVPKQIPQTYLYTDMYGPKIGPAIPKVTNLISLISASEELHSEPRTLFKGLRIDSSSAKTGLNIPHQHHTRVCGVKILRKAIAFSVSLSGSARIEIIGLLFPWLSLSSFSRISPRLKSRVKGSDTPERGPEARGEDYHVGLTAANLPTQSWDGHE